MRDGLAVSDSPPAHCTGLITVSLFRVVSKSINTLQAPYIKADSVQPEQIEGKEKDTTERLEVGPLSQGISTVLSAQPTEKLQMEATKSSKTGQLIIVFLHNGVYSPRNSLFHITQSIPQI